MSEMQRENRCQVPEMRGEKPTQGAVEVASLSRGEEPTDESLLFISLGEEQIKRAVPFLNEVLRQLVTLSTALMGGSIAFLKADTPIHPTAKTSAAVLFLLALLAALFGVLPYRSTIRPLFPNDIKRSVQAAMVWKDRLVWLSSGFLVVGLVVVLFGLWLSPATQPPPLK
jgi:hypothetical protein